MLPTYHIFDNMPRESSLQRGSAGHNNSRSLHLHFFLEVRNRAYGLYLLESEWIVIDILVVTALEVHPVEVRFGDVESVTAHVLEVDHRLLLFRWADVLVLEALAPTEEILKKHQHVQDPILARDRYDDLTCLVALQDVLQPVKQLLLVNIVIDLAQLLVVLDRRDVPICYEQTRTLEDIELQGQADRRLVVIDVEGVDDGEFVVFDVPDCSADGVATRECLEHY